eukprot:6005683-Ditylum_brightwellii.AAC.1
MELYALLCSHHGNHSANGRARRIMLTSHYSSNLGIRKRFTLLPPGTGVSNVLLQHNSRHCPLPSLEG